MVEVLLKKVADKLKSQDAKASLGDYIKLVQLRKELNEDEQPREIRVTWIEPSEMEGPGVTSEAEAGQERNPETAANGEKSESGG